MLTENLHDLHAFATIAEHGSFTKAAARMGVSQSALSQTIRGLEERLGIRLLSRTTRSVSPTEAGARLLATLAPALRDIDESLTRLNELRDKPAGNVRLTADEFAVHYVLWPKIARLLPKYPDVHVEITSDYGLTDIVAGQYDAGVRRGRLVSQDMIAVRISPDIRMAVVGAPAYFRKHEAPRSPQELTAHACINIRLPTNGEFFTWRFRKGGRERRIKVEGPLVFNTLASVVAASVDGFGLTYVPQELVAPQLRRGTLVEVLVDWRQTFEGYHLYYPHRRYPTPAFSLVLEALRADPKEARRRV